MPRKAFRAQEADAREDRFARGEILTLQFSHSANNPLSLTGAAFDTAYVADKDYAIRSIAISAIATGVTTEARGICGISLSDPSGIDLFGNVKEQVGAFIAALTFKDEAHQVLEYGADDEKECVYLSKGNKLYPFLRNESADGKSSCIIIVRLLPVGKQ